MQNHTRVYYQYFDLPLHQDTVVLCELCDNGTRAQDIHHLNGRGKGKDVIENLMGLCRKHHEKCHADPVFNEIAKEIHKGKLEWKD